MKALIPSRALIIDVIVFLLIGLFIYAAVSKLIDYQRFAATIGKSPLISKHASWLASAVPGGEIVISIMLLAPKLRIIGLYLSFTLMSIFTLYIAFILSFSPFVPCSCGGILNEMGWTEHLIFNSLFTAMTLWGIIIVPNSATEMKQMKPAIQ